MGEAANNQLKVTGQCGKRYDGVMAKCGPEHREGYQNTQGLGRAKVT